MNASVVRGVMKLGDVDGAMEYLRRDALPALGRIPGCKDSQVWVNRETGEFIGVGIYERAEAREAASGAIGEVMAQASAWWEGSGHTRAYFDLAGSTAEEERTLIERGIAAFNSGDLERFARASAPEIVYLGQNGEEFRGPQAVKD